MNDGLNVAGAIQNRNVKDCVNFRLRPAAVDIVCRVGEIESALRRTGEDDLLGAQAASGERILDFQSRSAKLCARSRRSRSRPATMLIALRREALRGLFELRLTNGPNGSRAYSRDRVKLASRLAERLDVPLVGTTAGRVMVPRTDAHDS
jgi:hypothetical protein